jgi:uncharacterized RDD family membrane protein YckC
MTARYRAADAVPAGLALRLLAIAYDTLIVLGLLVLAAGIALPLDFLGQRAFRDPLFTLYLAAVWFLYEACCWRRAGMTLGMRAWRIRLVSGAGGTPGWGRCLVRFLLGIVSFLALGGGFLWALGDPHRRTWHDLATGTRLIRLRNASYRPAQDQHSTQREQQ